MGTLRSKLGLQFALPICRAAALVGILTAVFSGTASAQIFSPYKDVTIDANWNTGQQQSGVTGSVEPVTSAMPNSTLSWAFATGTCGSETWAGVSPALEASNVADFVSAGKDYIVSTGGADGTFDCPSDSGMDKFISTYYSSHMKGVDYDIEGGQSQGVIDDLINSTKYAEGKYPGMRFSFTVATLGAATTDSDLNSLGDLVMSEISRLGLGGNYFVDLMAFDYGSVSSTNCVVSGGSCDMAQSAIAAAESLHSHFGTPYSHIELCLMIGEADAGPSETLSLGNVDTIVSWGKSVGLGGYHFWSFDRDQPSGASSSTGDGTGNPALSYTRRFNSDVGGGGGGSGPPPASFSMSDSPTSLSIGQGASGTSKITVASSNGFKSTVSLSVSGLPAGVSASLSSGTVTPPSDGSASANLTLTADSSATAGSSTVKITGISGALTESTSVALTVTGSGGGGGCTPTAIIPYIQVNGGAWAEENAVSVASGAKVNLGPQPTTGGSWSWSGPGGYTSAARQINGIPLSAGTNTYTATYTNTCGTKSTETFTITVGSGGGGGGGGTGTLKLSPTSYNFGSTAPGTGTGWQVFTLSNGGSSAVSIGSVSVSGPFVVSSSCGSSVVAGGSCPIYVYFAPTSAGSFTGTLTVTDNGTQTAALSGTGS